MTKAPKKKADEKPSPSDDEILRRMLNTPPKPHKPPKPKPKKPKSK